MHPNWAQCRQRAGRPAAPSVGPLQTSTSRVAKVARQRRGTMGCKLRCKLRCKLFQENIIRYTGLLSGIYFHSTLGLTPSEYRMATTKKTRTQSKSIRGISSARSANFLLLPPRNSLPDGIGVYEPCATAPQAPPVWLSSPLTRPIAELPARGLAGFLKVSCQPGDRRTPLDATVDGALT